MAMLMNSMDKIKLIPNGEKILIKDIFKKFGAEVYFPRKGDNNERFDAVIDYDSYKIVTEIEIPSSEILDAPRNLLDDYAVLKNRMNSSKTIIPLVICWDLPNKRTDYWNVVTDIKNILGIEVKTVSVLCLALYYWTNTQIDFTNANFFLDNNNMTISSAIEILEANHLKSEDFIGYFSPYK